MSHAVAHQTYSAEFKLQVVVASFQQGNTLTHVSQEWHVPLVYVSRWRNELLESVANLFADKRNPQQRSRSQGFPPGESPEDLKKMIQELIVQNAILKKGLGLLGC